MWKILHKGCCLGRVLGQITGHPLNRKRKMLAVLRFVWWQVYSRLVGRPVVMSWIKGSRFFARTGEHSMTVNIYNGLHEFEDMTYVLHVLSSDDLFVDIGANAGSYSILAAGVCGARVIAFEPIPETYERLRKNMALNHLEQRVECHNMALGAHAEELVLTGSQDCMNHVLADAEYAATTVRIQADTLDSMMGSSRPFMLKMDVEGFEWNVLQGAQAVLRQPTLQAILVEINSGAERYGVTGAKITALLVDHGFMPYRYHPETRDFEMLSGPNTTGNTLFIRDIEEVHRRVKSAVSFCVHGVCF
ncbi:MAG TPA: FkbM family methyltransferase [Rhodospirillaceae bacterium]|nr:FkbM family methyltransferase [Rhodospirillaceae bacterium]